ncbi:rhodanese-like domain-containing protein [Deinococcus koreensis]|uniref:rhodanese-like domain-containing protein n=1 Tax=Deinococcus koreensis TaxID=2054903 RepID=UPI001FAF3A95|nr:rhodanese-like domain-containing protein [Deinococcus koreensis]
MHTLLAEGSALVLDARPQLEWAISHLPDAITVGPKPGVAMSDYVGDVRGIARLAHGDWSVPLLIYCNGPYCRKTTRLAAELENAGFTDIRCYHLGAPVWRALGGLMVTEREGAVYIFQQDQSACWVDARSRAGGLPAHVPCAVRLPPGSVTAAKNDGRLPMQDHNTRMVVFGDTIHEARSVAQELISHAFHNVTYFNGPARLLSTTLQAAGPGRRHHIQTHRRRSAEVTSSPSGETSRENTSSAKLFALGILVLLTPASAHRACLSAASSPMPDFAAFTVQAWSSPLAAASRHDHAATSFSSPKRPSLLLRAVYGVRLTPQIPGLQPVSQHFAWGPLDQAGGQSAGVSQALNTVEHLREERQPERPAVLSAGDSPAVDDAGIQHFPSLP